MDVSLHKMEIIRDLVLGLVCITGGIPCLLLFVGLMYSTIKDNDEEDWHGGDGDY